MKLLKILCKEEFDMNPTKPLLLIFAILLFSGMVSALDATGLVSYYSFDSDATDAVSGYDLTTAGSPTLVSGVRGNCYQYDGDDDDHYATSYSYTSTGENLTVCAWFYPHNAGADSFAMSLKNDSTTNFDIAYIQFRSDNFIDIYGDMGFAWYNNYAYTEDKWVFVCLTLDNGTNATVHYNASVRTSDTTISENFGLNYLYVASQNGGNEFNGSIDEITIWNRVLNLTEISELYNNSDAYAFNIDNSNLNLWVNNSHPSCSDSYSRLQANNSNTPFCTLDAPLTNDKAVSGDKIIVARGNYNGESDISSRTLTGNINITCETDLACNLTRIDYDFNGTNGLWTRTDTNTYTASLTVSDATPHVRVYYQNGTIAYPYDSLADFNADTYGFASYYSSGTLYMKMPQNPNTTALYVADDYRPIKIYNTDVSGGDIILHGFNFPYVGRYGVYIENTNNVIVEKCNFNGGEYGVYYDGKDNTDNTNITIRNNNFDGQTYSWFTGNDLKNTGYMENGAIHVQNMKGAVYIYDNYITRYHGAIELITDGTKEQNNSRIYNNLITRGRGSQIEVELSCYNSWFYNNTILNGTLSGLSVASSDASDGTCYFINNTINLLEEDYWNVGIYADSYGIKIEERSGVYTQGWVFDHNDFIGGRGIDCINGETDSWRGVNFTNNIIVGKLEFAVDCFGTTAYNNYWNYNLYYKETAGFSYLLRNYNSTGNQAYTTLANARASSYAPATWDTGSIEANPTLDENNIPYPDSPVCGAGIGGTDIGSHVCSSDVVPPAYDNITTNATVATTYTSDVKITGEVFSDNNISAYVISIKNNSDSTWYNLTMQNFDGSSNVTIDYNWSISDFNLSGGTQYFKIWANTSSGDEDESSEFSFVVGSLSTPYIVSFTTPTVTTSTITWSVEFNTYVNISGTYGNGTSYTGNTFTNDTYDMIFTFVFSGLTNNTAYNFNITEFYDLSNNLNNTGYTFSATTVEIPMPIAYDVAVDNTSFGLANFIKLYSLIAGILVLIIVFYAFTTNDLDENMILFWIMGIVVSAIGLVILLAFLNSM